MSHFTTAKKVYDRLKEEIVSCALAPGTDFSEADLCARFKVSRTPVREACLRLEREGLIRIIPYKGYFVAPLILAEFHALQEVQVIVDPAAAGLAAHRATVEEIKQMESWAKYEYNVGAKSSYYDFLDLNLNLHVAIAQATRNEHLAQIVADIHMRLLRFFYLGLSMDSYGPQLVKEHMAIVAAIKSHDAIAARRQAKEHARNTIRRSQRLFVAESEVPRRFTSRDLGVSPPSTLKSLVQWKTRRE